MYNSIYVSKKDNRCCSLVAAARRTFQGCSETRLWSELVSNRGLSDPDNEYNYYHDREIKCHDEGCGMD